MLNTLGYTIRNNRLAWVFPFSVIGRGQPSVLLEVMAEERICWEIQGIGNLLDGHVAGAKHGFSLNDYMLADMFHRQFAGCESDEFGEVFWADAEPVRIELDSAFPVGIELEIVFETQEYFFLPGQALDGLYAGAYHLGNGKERRDGNGDEPLDNFILQCRRGIFMKILCQAVQMEIPLELGLIQMDG